MVPIYQYEMMKQDDEDEDSLYVLSQKQIQKKFGLDLTNE